FPLSQNPIQSKILTLFNSMKADRGEEVAEEKLKASRGCFMRLKERSHFQTIKVQCEAGSAKVEATASYPEDLATIIDIFSVNETAFCWKKKMPCRAFIAREEKSRPGFKASKGRPGVVAQANVAGDFKLKLMLIYHFENPKALKNYAKSSLPELYKWNNKARMTAHLFTAWFTEYFKPTVQTYCSEKKSFKILLLICNGPSHSRALIEMEEINVLMPAMENSRLWINTISILPPIDQGVILTFKSYYLRKTFHKAIAADSSDGCGQRKLKPFWKGIAILDSTKNIQDSWEGVKKVWKKLIPNLMDDFERFKTFVEEITADVMKRARKLELEVEPEDAAELQSPDKTVWMGNSQRKWILEVESTPGEDAANTVETTTKDVKYSINLVHKAVAGFERTDCSFEDSKMLSNNIACYREIFCERKSQWMWQISLLSYFKKLPQPPHFSNTTLINQQPSTLKQVPLPAKRL
uniref:DDE-1 domain-containing protein n=1 Tax=Chlorocebus sabaeus TaxID=60711 RepID=A0A0D9RGX8_CHLSB